MGGKAMDRSLSAASARQRSRTRVRPTPTPAAPARPDAERVERIIAILRQTLGEAACEYEHDSAFQLLVATILGSQSTPLRVNRVTPALFARYPDARALAQARPDELEAVIRPTGFYRFKAARLRQLAQVLCERHAGEVPRTLGALMRLPGVTRKTANAVLGDFFGLSRGFIVDPHVLRVSRRLGLTAAADPKAAERDLMALLPRERWIDLGNQLMWHGRRVCRVKQPRCHACALAPACPSSVIDDRPFPWGHGT